MKKYFLFLSIISFNLAFSQQPFHYSSADIYQGLKKLNVLGSVLYIAAHPDDENTRLLTYLSKEKLYRTGYLSITRGDGGQNLIGDEQGIELGLIRTQELLAARRIDGAEQFFTRAFDFGYSKTPEETFEKWGKENILSDVVWVIRKFQPDVIITRFPTTGEGGHGHHTASAILANEAFIAAGDPKRFPEQLKHVQPWQAKRILWNSFNFNNASHPTDAFRLDVGGYNSIIGKSYGEIASESRSQHKSQGFGVARTRGEAFEFFKATGGSQPQKDLFEEINTNWQRVNGSSNIGKIISDAIASYNFVHPEKSVPQLVQIYKEVSKLSNGYWKEQKLLEIKNLIESASGLWLEAFTSIQNAVQGDSLRITLAVNNRGGNNMVLKNVIVENYDSSFTSVLNQNKNVLITKTVFIDEKKSLSQPYWLSEKKEEGFFNVAEQIKIGQPSGDPSLIATFDLQIEGELFTYRKPVQYKYTDPVKGEIYEPVFVVPTMTVYTSPDIILFQKGKKEIKNVVVNIGANRAIKADELEARIRSSQFAMSQKEKTVSFAKNASKEYVFKLAGEEMGTVKKDYLQPFVHINNNKEEKVSYLATRSINYDHIPTIRYFFSDGASLLNIDLQTTGKRIGYITGAGDRVPEALTQMGYDVTVLNDKELARNNLQQFDAIITGVRAYNTNEWLNNFHDKLMKYVEDGGNLIVQYNTSNQIGPVKAKIGPYNFDISRNRITNENAPVTFLKPEHPVLNFPNKIVADDFKGWVQERSIYHASKPDVRFESILSMADPGEKADDGSLIITKHGKGYFTYTGLVFFRQLPAGVPGAYRLLANIIALNSKGK